MKKSVCIILIIKNELSLIQKSLDNLSGICCINELFIINNSSFSLNKINNLNKNDFLPKIKYINFDKNNNVVEGINNALRNCNSSYSLVLNDSQYLDAKALINLVNIFDENNSIKIIYTNSIYTDKKGNFLSLYPADSIENCLDDKKYLKPFNNASVFFRNKIFDLIGEFDIKFPYHFISEYIMRCLRYNSKLVRFECCFLSKSILNNFSIIDGYIDLNSAVEFFNINNKFKNKLY